MGLLTEVEMTQREFHCQKLMPAWVTSHKSWKPRVHYTIFSQCDSLENVSFEKQVVWTSSMKLSASLCLFQAVWMIWETSSISDSLRMSLSCPFCLCTLGEEEPSVSCQFQGPHEDVKLFISCLIMTFCAGQNISPFSRTSCVLRSLLTRWEVLC